MSGLEYSIRGNRTQMQQQRIMANLQVQASWVDAKSGDTILVDGVTENLGENSAMINLQTLPPVGSEVTLRIIDEKEILIETLTQVLRVERDPSKPLVALSVLENLRKWKHIALTAAQGWATRHLQLNYDYSGEWLN